MDSKTRIERQDTRVWAIEQLLREEGFLDPRMYECADYYASDMHRIIQKIYIHYGKSGLPDNPSDKKSSGKK